MKPCSFWDRELTLQDSTLDKRQAWSHVPFVTVNLLRKTPRKTSMEPCSFWYCELTPQDSTLDKHGTMFLLVPWTYSARFHVSQAWNHVPLWYRELTPQDSTLDKHGTMFLLGPWNYSTRLHVRQAWNHVLFGTVNLVYKTSWLTFRSIVRAFLNGNFN